jgi:hypothetical protein
VWLERETIGYIIRRIVFVRGWLSDFCTTHPLTDEEHRPYRAVTSGQVLRRFVCLHARS